MLTDGFSEKVRETMEFLVLVQELFPEFNKMETTITEKDLAIVVLSKK